MRNSIKDNLDQIESELSDKMQLIHQLEYEEKVNRRTGISYDCSTGHSTAFVQAQVEELQGLPLPSSSYTVRIEILPHSICDNDQAIVETTTDEHLVLTFSRIESRAGIVLATILHGDQVIGSAEVPFAHLYQQRQSLEWYEIFDHEHCQDDRIGLLQLRLLFQYSKILPLESRIHTLQRKKSKMLEAIRERANKDEPKKNATHKANVIIHCAPFMDKFSNFLFGGS